MDYSKLRQFHWLTWTVIGLLVLLLVSLAITVVFTPSSSVMGIMTGSLAGILGYVFLLAFIWIVACMIGGGLKAWLEKYLDALVEQKSGADNSGAKLAVLNENIRHMEDKLDRIEKVLVKVSE